MGGIEDYIKWRGDLTFEQSAFNEVDNLVLSQIAYVDFKNIIPAAGSKEKITLRQAAHDFFDLNDEEELQKVTSFIREAPFFMRIAAESRRFGDIVLSDYADVTDDHEEKQFAAFCAELPDDTYYIAFRGTDDTIIGWKEDFNMGVMMPVPSQLEAVEYVNTVMRWKRGKLRLGGHSKGGNLAIYAAVFAKPSIQRKVVKVYNNDGPGFTKEMIESEAYRKMLPQSFINQNAYGDCHYKLPAADYKVTFQTSTGKGVYSFCMCPGGYVVNASSEKERIAVNGMSYSGRNGDNANSAIIVTVTPEDFGSNILDGMHFQRRLENLAWREGNGQIPVQLYGDFKNNRISTGFGAVTPSIKGAYTFGNLNRVLPEFLTAPLKEGITGFSTRIKGFDMEEAVLSGVESRTSSPVRILRGDSLQSVTLHGLYPCGEGAGYAGGITSAAVDGLKIAEQIATN